MSDVAEATPETTALAVKPPDAEPSLTLFGSSDPVVVIKKARDVARMLADIINDRQLFANIQGKNYVLCEGWAFLGSLLGVFPQVIATTEIMRDGKLVGFEATSEARTRSGELISRGTARCMKSERRWGSADEYAVLSMAQTRSMGKTLRLPLGWVMTLAGYAGTPWEEMESVVDRKAAAPANGNGSRVAQALRREATPADVPPDDDFADGAAITREDAIKDILGVGKDDIGVVLEAAKALGFGQRTRDAMSADLPAALAKMADRHIQALVGKVFPT